MKITNANLIRLAGLSALLAGLRYVIVGVFHPANVPSSVTTTRWARVSRVRLRHVILRGARPGGNLRPAGGEVRLLGLVGFVMLSLWFVLIMGFSFVEAFVLPHSAAVSPAFVEGWMGMFNGDPSKINLGVLPTLWTLSGPLYILGGLLFGIATFRARILPRGAAMLLALGTALAPVAALLSLAAQPKIAIPTGLALGWLGYALMVERQTPAAHLDDHAITATV